MSSSSIRVRFAPSPTGMFHVGGARSALFNWALAEQSGGAFVLPIEDTDAMEDLVIARGDGSPLFILANVADDLEMRITHVVRAEEHLSNTPKQQLLWLALGAQPPVWAHVPVIVNEQRKKLSKRRDKVALESYRAEGSLAEAMVNSLILLLPDNRHMRPPRPVRTRPRTTP